MNFLGKALVLLQTILSLCAMGWAVAHVLTAKDIGYAEPDKEILEYKTDGDPKVWVRHASEYDKSEAALKEAKKSRDQIYVAVAPALDSLRETEQYLPQNHLFYKAELAKLRSSPDKIEVKRFKDGGLTLETPIIGRPEWEDKEIAGLTKSYAAYQADLRELIGEIKTKFPGKISLVEADISRIVIDTKAITAKLTGTDEANDYVQPGIYGLLDLEFRAQLELRIEIDDIKPGWSKAIEQARLFGSRRTNLEATLEKLKAALPKTKK